MSRWTKITCAACDAKIIPNQKALMRFAMVGGLAGALIAVYFPRTTSAEGWLANWLGPIAALLLMVIILSAVSVRFIGFSEASDDK